jgi:undecaprenyl-diphosphatase
MDFQIAKFFNNFGAGTFVDLLSIVLSSYLFLFVFWFGAAVFFLFFDKKNGKKIFLASFVVIILHLFFSEFIFKYLMINFWGVRPRPYLAHPGDIFPLGKNGTDSSFPSSHISGTVSVLAVFVYYYRRLIIPGIIFVLLMAFSRMHNGMHYPTDILAGVILGIILALSAIFAFKKIKN